ncbi:MAG: hypothetical protein LBI63_02535 [Candidatus Ancillula sp.]|jgi:hypothetical protein|nr:hypothetical protein [Candidatus Ancillula sp.]
MKDRTELDTTALDFTTLEDNTELDDGTVLAENSDKTELADRTALADATELDDGTVLEEHTELVDVTALEDSTLLADSTTLEDDTLLEDSTALDFTEVDTELQNELTSLKQLKCSIKKKQAPSSTFGRQEPSPPHSPRGLLALSSNPKYTPRTTPLRKVTSYIAQTVPAIGKYNRTVSSTSAVQRTVLKVLASGAIVWVISLLGVIFLR